LSWLCANDVDKAIGSITYTQMLSERAGIEADLTVARLDEELFYLVTGTAFATHDRHWIESHVPKRADVHIREVTSEIAVLAVMGPHSRDVLSTIVEGDLDNEAFPFGTMQVMSVAGVTTRLLRITYVGELGFELHIPTDDARGVYRAVTEAGQSFGIVNAGYRAIESLRLEKGYRAWAADITPSDTPLEAGLGWAVKLNSEIEFSGRARAEQQREEGIQRRLATFATADPDVTLLGRETILRNGKKVGWLTSGGWGYTVDAAIGLGYVNGPTAHSVDEMRRGTYELEVATVRVPAEIHFRSLYDPAMSRVRT
jgi:4-methylaminobutanoate oxidase (formaldehyde-forming)